MARKRMIDPSFWDDPDIGCLEPSDRLLAVAFISLADDYGHLSADPRYLCKQVYGYSAVTPEQVRQMRDRVIGGWRNIELYEVGGQEYVELLNWSRYQDLRYVGKPQWPAPNGKVPTPPTQGEGPKPPASNTDHASPAQGPRADHASPAEQIRLGKDSTYQESLDQAGGRHARTRETPSHLAIVPGTDETASPPDDGANAEDLQARFEAVVVARHQDPRELTVGARTQNAEMATWCFERDITPEEIIAWGDDWWADAPGRTGKRLEEIGPPTCRQLKEHYAGRLAEEDAWEAKYGHIVQR